MIWSWQNHFLPLKLLHDRWFKYSRFFRWIWGRVGSGMSKDWKSKAMWKSLSSALHSNCTVDSSKRLSSQRVHSIFPLLQLTGKKHPISTLIGWKKKWVAPWFLLILQPSTSNQHFYLNNGMLFTWLIEPFLFIFNTEKLGVWASIDSDGNHLKYLSNIIWQAITIILNKGKWGKSKARFSSSIQDYSSLISS